VPLNVVLVDDEAAARRRMRQLLDEIGGCRVVGEFAGGRAALDAIKAEPVDIAFLDIEMPTLDGMALAQAIGKESPQTLIVFVTAHDQYAVKAFDLTAADYLMKPVRRERLAASLTRLKSLVTGRERVPAELPPPAASPPGVSSPIAHRIEVKHGHRSIFVNVSEIDWFEADGQHVLLRIGPQSYTLNQTMRALEAALDPDRFARIHRSAIVNIARIRELQPWFGGDAVLVLTTGAKLRVSRTYRAQLRTRLRAL
jgi:two-component system LytT family response regulator